jgi:hypothetical protein
MSVHKVSGTNSQPNKKSVEKNPSKEAIKPKGYGISKVNDKARIDKAAKDLLEFLEKDQKIISKLIRPSDMAD